MNFKKIFISSLITFCCICSLTIKAEEKHIQVTYGVDKKGTATGQWIDENSNKTNNTQQKKLTSAEMAWAALINSRLDVWKAQLENIAAPYSTVEYPKQVTLVLGNQGGRDAFTVTSKFPNKIFFNLSVLAKSYKNANSEKNLHRIDRIFAHEYTHLLQHRWSENNPFALTSHFNIALNEAYKEGFGHFRSISTKWKDKHGKITEHGKKSLKNLEKVFVERMSQLVDASDVEAKDHMRGLSTGPFHKKWGALTVALWLTIETDGQDEKLAQWVDYGPEGILRLANKYLPSDLKTKLNKAVSLRRTN